MSHTTFGGGIESHIHQIWIGTNPRPDIWIDTIRDFCNKEMIQYTLWDDELVQTHLDWTLIPGLKEVYDSIETFSGKGDILRYLILYQYGGIYIDADSVLLRPETFKKFLLRNRADIFFAWEELGEADTEWMKGLSNTDSNIKGAKRLIANGTIGSKRGHSFLKLLLDSLESHSKEMKGKDAWRQTGPVFVTNIWKKHKHRFKKLKVYPMKYFYPVSWKGIKDPQIHLRMRFPPESMFFQYGYSTNNFEKIFRKRRSRTRKIRN